MILCEKSNAVGGQINLAHSLPGRAEFADFMVNLQKELSKTTARLHLNCFVNLDFIKIITSEVVICATVQNPTGRKLMGLITLMW